MRQGALEKEEARELSERTDPKAIGKLVSYYKNRHGLSDKDFDDLMAIPRDTHQSYKTYKKTFERLRPLFYVMLKNELISQSFYEKYCCR